MSKQTSTTRDRVLQLWKQDFSVREIANACGVSTQRVYQILGTTTGATRERGSEDGE